MPHQRRFCGAESCLVPVVSATWTSHEEQLQKGSRLAFVTWTLACNLRVKYQELWSVMRILIARYELEEVVWMELYKKWCPVPKVCFALSTCLSHVSFLQSLFCLFQVGSFAFFSSSRCSSSHSLPWRPWPRAILSSRWATPTRERG